MSAGRAARPLLIVGAAFVSLLPAIGVAQQQPTNPDWPQPVHNSPVLGYGILNQNEFRTGNGSSTYRWDGEGWYGNNLNRAWFKTEGNRNAGESEEAEAQALYSRAITRYFDLQAGARYDFGAGPSQTWAAFGIQGLAPHYFDLGAHLFVSGGHASIRVEGSRDLLITQRLILQPQAEFNFYGQSDSRRGIGAGFGDIDAGLRFRYEIRRQIAPYIGLTYVSKYGRTADLARLAGEATHRLQLTAGVRLWF